MAIAVMETLEFSWLADVEECLTIVDKARQWAGKQTAALFGEPGSELRQTASLYSADSRRRKVDRLASLTRTSGSGGKGGAEPGCLAAMMDMLLRDADEEAEIKARRRGSAAGALVLRACAVRAHP